MDEWSKRLAGIDDDYLVGISNKGIVKRAYKDKEESAAEIVGMEEEAQVKVGEETVTVRFPLGESKCTCPSRSICRHVVQAILTLKESCGRQERDAADRKAAGETGTEDMAAGQTSMGQAGQAAPGQSMAEEAAAGQTAPGQNMAEEAAAGQTAPGQGMAEEAAAGQTVPGQSAAGKLSADPEAGQSQDPQKGQTAVLKEISEYPFAKLKKALGNRYFQTFVGQAAGDMRPRIQYTSVVTVSLPEPGITVKLLSPLEYSTCTCHKKELCRHKAAAILWCQLEAGALNPEALQKEAAQDPVYDLDEVRDAAGQMCAFLEELMDTGLSRVSPDVLDYLERLAIIAHNAGLARFEGYFRALADSYDRYLKRKAAFQARSLMEQITRLYRRAQKLGQAQDASQVAALAGEFRADYLPVGNLDLIGIAAEQYKSQTGYEGETIYFLEEHTGKWYTYTNAKPVFYDGARRRGSRESSGALQGPAPWELGISMEKLLKIRIRLTGAKCDGRNRLSSSQETRGEIRGEQGLHISDIKGWYYRDFGKLFQERIGLQGKRSPGAQGNRTPEDEPTRKDELIAEDGLTSEGGSMPQTQGNAAKSGELVFVQPDSCAKAEFSQTGQQLTLPLYDRAGHELLVEVTYSKQEAGTIRYLERISEKKLPCFLGKVFLRDGRLRMYPVDLLDIDASEAAWDWQDSGTADRKNAAAGRKNTADESLPGDSALARQTKYNIMEDMAEEILLLMEDLCQSGFGTVHDSTLKDLRKAAGVTKQYGMGYLSQLIGKLADETEAGRHQMKKTVSSMYRDYTDIIEYMNLLRQKTAYDRGADYYG